MTRFCGQRRAASAWVGRAATQLPSAISFLYFFRIWRIAKASPPGPGIAQRLQGAFHLRRYGNTVSLNQRSPDSYWFGGTPTLLREIRGGKEVDNMIDRLYSAAENYPYDKQYRVWPGPNSNTFVAWLGRALPELELELPATAIGKDYLPGGALFARTPSNTGVQFSLGGAFGLLVGVEEGVEVNLLGFSAGIDLQPPAIKLPGIGRIGVSDFKSSSYSEP